MIEVNTHCKYCLKEMDAKSVRAVFCSSKCRVYFRRETEYKSRKEPLIGSVTNYFKPVLAPINKKKGNVSIKSVIIKPNDTTVLNIRSLPDRLPGEYTIDYKIRCSE